MDKLVITITPCRCMCKAGSSQGQLLFVEGEFFKPHEENPSDHNMVKLLPFVFLHLTVAYWHPFQEINRKAENYTQIVS